MNERNQVVITDYDYGDVDIERSILEPTGARVVALQAKSESDLFDEVVDCAAVMNQYAYVGAAAIERMQQCQVIARYGVGVDIVDVEAATDKGILVTNVRDYCVMQAPMKPDTRHFLGEPEFRRMKTHAIVVNTGRGPTIDNAALYRALSEGWIGAAGLDDPEEEPAKRAAWDPAENPIFSLPNVIVTPHAAYYSEESIRAAREGAAREVASVLTGKTPQFPVNDAALAARPQQKKE